MIALVLILLDIFISRQNTVDIYRNYKCFIRIAPPVNGNALGIMPIFMIIGQINQVIPLSGCHIQ
jgi:hypothetical protein